MHYNNFFIRKINELYNFCFIKINKIKYFKEIKKKNFLTNNKNLKYSYNLQNVWLLNLKKLIEESKKKINFKEYIFLDVGCGNGIPIYFVAKKYKFQSYMGIDIEKINIINTKKNIKCLQIKKINIYQKDASKFYLKNNKYFIFMYNPFQKKILKKFLENNIKIIKKNSCVIGYSNLDNNSIFKKYKPSDFINFNKYKLQLFFF